MVKLVCRFGCQTSCWQICASSLYEILVHIHCFPSQTLIKEFYGPLKHYGYTDYFSKLNLILFFCWSFPKVRERFNKEAAFEDITLEAERKRIFRDFVHAIEVTFIYNSYIACDYLFANILIWQAEMYSFSFYKMKCSFSASLLCAARSYKAQRLFFLVYFFKYHLRVIPAKGHC